MAVQVLLVVFLGHRLLMAAAGVALQEQMVQVVQAVVVLVQ
jgi:hypothetical protein